MNKGSPNRAAFEAAFTNGSTLSLVFDLQYDDIGDAGETFAHIHSSGSHNVLSWFQKLNWAEIESGRQIRLMRILRVFCANVKEPADVMVPFLCTLRNSLSTDHSHHLNEAFRGWCNNNPAMMQEVAKFISDAYEGANIYVASLITAWRNHNIEEALQAALTFSNSAISETRRQSIYALGFFEFETAAQTTLVEDRLIEIAKNSDTIDQRMALAAMARILEKQDPKSIKLIASLELAASSSSSDLRDELIACLAFQGKGFPKELRKKIFDLMKNVSSNCHETISNIDMVLGNTDLDADKEMVFDTLNAILNQETEAPQFSAFDSFEYKLKSSSHNVHGWYVIRWLLEGRYQVCNQLSDLFTPLDLTEYNFSVKKFKLKPDEVFYLSRKIFAYFLLCRGPAVSLLCGCLIALNLSDRKSLEGEIVSFWLRNYPNDIDLFDQVCAAFPQSGLKTSIARMRAKIQEYEKPLRSQLSNLALNPSERERRVQAELAYERNRQVTRLAEENSIFVSMISKVAVLYGRSSVNYIHSGGPDEPKRQVTPFQTIETKSDLPIMHCLYPSWMNFVLYKFRTEKRPQ